VSRAERPKPAATGYLAPHPLAGLRGRLGALLYRLAAAVAGTTPCPTCQTTRQRIGSGGRAAERRAWREGWNTGRRRPRTPAT